MRHRICRLLTVAVATLAVAACSTEPDPAPPSESSSTSDQGDPADTSDIESEEPTAPVDAVEGSSSFQIEVWADNWMAVHVNGQLVGEDSVPITTERSFNSETFTFDASYPLTVAIEAKDFKQTDSGLEYIGQPNQQMGDGGLIAQVTDLSTGEVVLVTDSTWRALVIHRAPLNPECEDDPDPDATCEFESIEAPDGWTDPGFDDAAWSSATEWSSEAVRPKDGYDQITWDGEAQFIWGTDLEVDNTVLLRSTVTR